MLEALLALACIGACAALVRATRAVSGDLAETGRCVTRLRAAHDESRRLLDARQRLAAAQQATEAVVEIGTQTVQAVHQAIAAVPFTILEAIPGVREPTRLVRAAHDAVSQTVYGALGGINKWLGAGLRGALGDEPGASRSKTAEREGREEPQKDAKKS